MKSSDVEQALASCSALHSTMHWTPALTGSCWGCRHFRKHLKKCWSMRYLWDGSDAGALRGLPLPPLLLLLLPEVPERPGASIPMSSLWSTGACYAPHGTLKSPAVRLSAPFALMLTMFAERLPGRGNSTLQLYHLFMACASFDDKWLESLAESQLTNPRLMFSCQALSQPPSVLLAGIFWHARTCHGQGTTINRQGNRRRWDSATTSMFKLSSFSCFYSHFLAWSEVYPFKVSQAPGAAAGSASAV